MPKPVGSAGRYMPGLDGLRAFAVLAVIAYHLELGWAKGGMLGVGVFFTLSGYLITDLLLEQREAIGRLRLGEFWIRRARRLLPALFLMLAVVVIWVALLEPSRLQDLRGDVVAAALYVSNWWYIFGGDSYFAQFGPPPILDHLWSLAVEEQFYLVWPLLLLLVLRYLPGRYWLVGLTVMAAVLSASAMALLYQPGSDPTRVYEGTDTRAFGLLVGAALAMVWPSRGLRVDLGSPERSLRHSSRLLRGLRVLDTMGLVGLVIIALLIWQTDQYSPFMYRGGIVLLSVATALVVAAVATPFSGLGRVLGWAPLSWLGVRSYGIYLWHYPIIVLSTPSMQSRVTLPGADVTLAIVQVGLTIVVAALSWRFFEEPIRRGALGRFWEQLRSGGWRRRAIPLRRWAASAGALGILMVALASLGGVVPAAPIRFSTEASSISAEGGGLPPPPEEASTESTSSTDQEPPATTSEAPPTSAPKYTAATRTSCDAVAYIGDSTSEGMISPRYLPDKEDRLGAQFARVGATSQSLKIQGATSIVETLSADQDNAQEVARKLKERGFKGCWVIALANNEAANVHMGSQVGVQERIERMMKVIGEQPVMWVNTKTLLESGPYSNANMERWNRTLEQSCSEYPNMRVFDWSSAAKEKWFISDGTHFSSEGYAQRARLSADALAQAFPASGAPASGKEQRSSCVVP